MKRIGFCLLFLMACTQVNDVEISEQNEVSLQEEANRLSQELLLLDTHIDVPYRLRRSDEDISQRTEAGDFDYPRARRGGLNGAFMSIYVPASVQSTGGATQYANKLIDMVESFESRWPDKFAMARSIEDIEDNFDKGLFSLALGIENGAAIEGNLQNLRHFRDRGVRYMTLTHSKVNGISDSSFDSERKWNGLSGFGLEVVGEMNRLGLIVDVSHVTDEAFYEALEVSKTPLIASHSSCRFFTPGWERNMSDEMIKALAGKGGVIQINFGASFLNDEYRKLSFGIWDSLREKGIAEDGPEARSEMERERARMTFPRVTVEDVVKHINHVVSLVGVEHVGLGSDFDGVGPNLPVDLRDVSQYPNLLRELLRAGYSKGDLRKICSGNMLRVWKEVEKYAAQFDN